MSQKSNFFVSIGKKTYDEYGREIGRVTSLSVDPEGKVDSAFIQHGNGKVVKYPAEKLKIDDSGVTLLSETKVKADSLSDRIPLIWRKNQALKDLVDEDKISPDVYEDLHNSFDGVLNQLKREAKELMEEIKRETERCDQEIKDLNYALVNLEIEHKVGKIDDQSYHESFNTIQDSLEKANAEKEDLEEMKSKLSNTLLGEIETEEEKQEEMETVEETEEVEVEEAETVEEEKAVEETEEEPEVQEESPTSTGESSNFPEPPSVVYVREASQSSA